MTHANVLNRKLEGSMASARSSPQSQNYGGESLVLVAPLSSSTPAGWACSIAETPQRFNTLIRDQQVSLGPASVWEVGVA